MKQKLHLQQSSLNRMTSERESACIIWYFAYPIQVSLQYSKLIMQDYILKPRDIYRSLHNAVQFCISHAELQNCVSLGLDYFKFNSLDATDSQLSKRSSLGNILLLYSIQLLKLKLLCCSTHLAQKLWKFSPCRSLIQAAKTVMLEGCFLSPQ